jgi:hypothetical protein
MKRFGLILTLCALATLFGCKKTADDAPKTKPPAPSAKPKVPAAGSAPEANTAKPPAAAATAKAKGSAKRLPPSVTELNKETCTVAIRKISALRAAGGKPSYSPKRHERTLNFCLKKGSVAQVNCILKAATLEAAYQCMDNSGPVTGVAALCKQAVDCSCTTLKAEVEGMGKSTAKVSCETIAPRVAKLMGPKAEDPKLEEKMTAQFVSFCKTKLSDAQRLCMSKATTRTEVSRCAGVGGSKGAVKPPSRAAIQRAKAIKLAVDTWAKANELTGWTMGCTAKTRQERLRACAAHFASKPLLTAQAKTTNECLAKYKTCVPLIQCLSKAQVSQ